MSGWRGQFTIHYSQFTINILHSEFIRKDYVGGIAHGSE